MSDNLPTIDEVLYKLRKYDMTGGEEGYDSKEAKYYIESIIAEARIDELNRTPTNGFDEKFQERHEYGSQYIEDRHWYLDDQLTHQAQAGGEDEG